MFKNNPTTTNHLPRSDSGVIWLIEKPWVPESQCANSTQGNAAKEKPWQQLCNQVSAASWLHLLSLKGLRINNHCTTEKLGTCEIKLLVKLPGTDKLLSGYMKFTSNSFSALKTWNTTLFMCYVCAPKGKRRPWRGEAISIVTVQRLQQHWAGSELLDWQDLAACPCCRSQLLQRCYQPERSLSTQLTHSTSKRPQNLPRLAQHCTIFPSHS